VEVFMKRALFIYLFIIPLWLIAQEIPFSVKSETKYGSSGMVGSTKVDSVKYTQIRLIQELKLWKFDIGLDMDFLLDKNHHLKKDDWDHFSDVPNKIYYLRYAKKGDPFYAHLGGFPGHTLSNGLIMLNYSNMQLYPDLRNTGLMLGENPRWPMKPNFEVFSSNVVKNQILSFATHFQPLPDSTIRYLDQTILGFSAVTDRNQYGNIKYVVPDSIYHLFNKRKKESVTVYSFDYSLPITLKNIGTFRHYAELAHITNYGSGIIFPGFYTEFKSLKVNLEFRRYGAKFVPAFFDRHYEEQRASLIGNQIFTKEEELKAIRASFGWYGKVQTNIKGKVKAMVAWQDMYGKELKTGKSFWLRFWADTQYHRLENFSLSYDKLNVEHMALNKIIVPSADISASVTFRITEKKWFLIGSYSESYDDRNGNNKINYLKETRRSVAVGVKYIF
jgi:hypothetical protein